YHCTRLIREVAFTRNVVAILVKFRVITGCLVCENSSNLVSVVEITTVIRIIRLAIVAWCRRCHAIAFLCQRRRHETQSCPNEQNYACDRSHPLYRHVTFHRHSVYCHTHPQYNYRRNGEKGCTNGRDLSDERNRV